jgi:hypothetical protein
MKAKWLRVENEGEHDSLQTLQRVGSVVTVEDIGSSYQNVRLKFGRAIAQAVSRRLPTAAARVQSRVWSCGILWWTKVALGQVFSENFGFPPANLHSICFSTIIFTITRGWHNRPGVAAVPIASQSRIKKKSEVWKSILLGCVTRQVPISICLLTTPR